MFGRRRSPRVVFLRFRAQGRGKDTLAFLFFLGRISPCSPRRPLLIGELLQHARCSYFSHSHILILLSLSLSLSLCLSFSRTIGMAREIEYLPRQDVWSRIHGAIVARSRFFSVILYTNYCIRIIEFTSF